MLQCTQCATTGGLTSGRPRSRLPVPSLCSGRTNISFRKNSILGPAHNAIKCANHSCASALTWSASMVLPVSAGLIMHRAPVSNTDRLCLHGLLPAFPLCPHPFASMCSFAVYIVFSRARCAAKPLRSWHVQKPIQSLVSLSSHPASSTRAQPLCVATWKRATSA